MCLLALIQSCHGECDAPAPCCLGNLHLVVTNGRTVVRRRWKTGGLIWEQTSILYRLKNSCTEKLIVDALVSARCPNNHLTKNIPSRISRSINYKIFARTLKWNKMLFHARCGPTTTSCHVTVLAAWGFQTHRDRCICHTLNQVSQHLQHQHSSTLSA